MSLDSQTPDPMLNVEELCVSYPIRTGLLKKTEIASIRAVDGVSFAIERGKTLGLVGESGCGKSTVGRAVLGLLPTTSGLVEVDGLTITGLTEQALRPHRRNMQMVFQDPYSSLNPRMSVGDIIAEPIAVHGLRPRSEIAARVAELISLVGMDPLVASRYPHEFSGGQRQRIGIARALAVEPSLIVCDEPVSALDVSIQAQVLNLLDDLQRQLGLTYMFIAHGLAVVKHISDHVAVMYLGKIVEMAETNALYATPRHPYTQSLLSAAPVPDPDTERNRKRIILKGEMPSPLNPPSGCRFHTRCPLAIAKCSTDAPPMESNGAGHFTACWRAGETI